MKSNPLLSRIAGWLLLGALLAGCLLPPAALAAPTTRPNSTLFPAPQVTRRPTATPIPLPPLPELSLEAGHFYWSLNHDQQSFLLSRNMAGYLPGHYFELFDLTQRGGSRLVRIQLDSFGAGYTPEGDIDEKWARQWEQVFDDARGKGLYIIVMFSGWVDWNTTGFNTWDQNPLNSANGGPAQSPKDLMDAGSATQEAFLRWVDSVVVRWQGRENIVAWELYSEVNLTEGVNEAEGIEFVERGAAVIRHADPRQRPVTASLADTGAWPNFYALTSLDFINVHPYPLSAQLDRVLVSEVRQQLATYGKPVLIGESGLNADSPENYPPNAQVGVRHAIWAGVVSGAMNGRSLYWEDSFGMYFSGLGWPWLYQYAELELPAARFVQHIDFADFRPLIVHFPADTALWGAALGSQNKVIGWVRDITSEPPDWHLQGTISGQRLTIAVPGSRPLWRLEFFDTQTGTDVISTHIVTRQQGGISFTLPDLSDDIAFRLTALSDVIPTPPPPATTDPIAGTWEGEVSNENFSTSVEISVQPACQPGNVCATTSAPALPCSGDLFLQEIVGEAYIFVETNMSGASFCQSGGAVVLWLQPGRLLSYRYSGALPSPLEQPTTDGMLHP